MDDLRQAAEMALEFVEWLCSDDHSVKPKNNALKTREALRQALAQPEQEPVATVVKRQYEDGTYAGNALDWAGRNSEDDFPVGTKLYTAPPKREWVGLTDQEIKEIIGHWGDTPIKGYTRRLFDQIESKLKEKNA